MKTASTTSYTVGFLASIVLTLVAFGLVAGHVVSGMTAIVAIFTLAFIQLIIQLVFFLHLSTEAGQRWKLFTFLSTFGLVFIIVAGSVWIMYHLNYNMMASPALMQEYIESQQAF